MADDFGQQKWSERKETPRPSGMSSVGPPPVEVEIRTMASDTESMAKSGGGQVKSESVSVSFKSRPVEPAGSESGAPGQPAFLKNPSKSRAIVWSVIIMAAGLGLFLAGYYFLPLFVSFRSSRPAAVTLPTPVSSTASSQTASSTETPPLSHQSFFSQPVDAALILKIPSSTAGFQAESQQLKSFLAGFSSTSTFFEAAVQNEAGQQLSAAGFFSSINAPVLDVGFLDNNFNPDFTLFLYRDKNNLWPGFSLQIKTGQTPLLLQSDVRKIELASSSWSNLFLNSPGTSTTKFQDSLISGQPVRILNFSSASSVLAYGWFFNKYLIISTSLEGLKQAIRHF